MSMEEGVDVFVSYAREDEGKAARLVRALDASGLSVAWDRSISGAAEIQRAREAARCVVVVWTPASVENAAVREEAAHAQERTALVPVTMAKTKPPHGFETIKPIDLVGWSGSVTHVFFIDLVGVIRAKLLGVPPPRLKGPGRRALQRAGIQLPAIAVGLAGIGLLADVFSLQGYFCSVGGETSQSVCGNLGLSGFASDAERANWSEIKSHPGSCEALSAHIRKFPRGAYAAEAQRLLDNPKKTPEGVWSPERLTTLVSLYASGEPKPASEARAATQRRAVAAAEDACREYVASGLFRYVDSQILDGGPTCTSYDAGLICGFEGRAECSLLRRAEAETLYCGPDPDPQSAPKSPPNPG